MGENKSQYKGNRSLIIPMFFLTHFLVSLLLTFFPISCSPYPIPDYKEALSKSLLYFESQRSGRLPYNQRVRWRHHSGLMDGLEQGVDLVGGYYDAGDNVKFGLPMAFTITMLSWGVIEFRRELAAAGELRYAIEAIKWGTDYFIKAHSHPNVLWAQVGDGDTDHLCWQRAEDMSTSRRAYKVDEQNPGSEVAAEAAAAMAAASIVFRSTNPHYSRLLLEHAKQLFEFGDKYRGKYDETIEGAQRHYPSVSGYNDELLWAAAWLNKATDGSDQKYMAYTIHHAHDLGGVTWSITEFSWDVKYAGLQIMLSMIPKEGKKKEEVQILEKYKSKAEHYICSCLNMNNFTNVKRTPGGLLYTREWNNMQYVSSSVFLLTIYSDYLHKVGETVNCDRGSVDYRDLLALVESQVDYILGKNPIGMSYLVGYGHSYPQRVHHRGASMEPFIESKAFIGCCQGYDTWYSRWNPNPNILVGALVGGPNGTDGFMDVRGNFKQTEACTYNTAPLVGVFAKLHSIQGGISISKDSPTISSYV